ncbi:MAG: DMT family transporter [bacterium]|nr:DMT family transporter [bacterium]
MKNITKASALTLICIIWGVNWVAIKVSLEGFSPFWGATFRFLLAVIALYIYVLWKKIPLRVTRREFYFLLLVGFLTHAVNYGLLFWGEQYLSAGVTSIFFSTFALFTAICSNFLFKSEPFRWNKYFGLLVGLSGVFVVFYDQLAKTSFDKKVMLASIAVLVAALGAAIGTVIIKKYLSKMNSVVLSFHQMWLGTLMLAVLALTIEPFKIELNPRVFWTMIYMGIIASAAAFVIYYNLLQHMSAVSLSFIIYVIPIIALISDYFIYGELLSMRSCAGTVIIFTGIWLNDINKKKVDWVLNRLGLRRSAE